MTKVFVKQADLKLVNGGYVVTGKEETPVSNEAFIAAQKRAEYVVMFAAACKGKDFKGKAADSVHLVAGEVLASLNNQKKEYVKVGNKPAQKITKELASEALAFINFDKKSTKTEKVNNFLQEFNIIDKFEKIGLYFDKEVVELNKIYTMDEVVKAVEATIDLV